MKKIHDRLMRTSRWYAAWHQHPNHSAIHAVLFALVAFVIVVSMMTAPRNASTVLGAAEPGRPQFSLDLTAYLKGRKGIGGDEAVNALGRTVSTIARAYGITAAELKGGLRNDKTLKINKEGYLFFDDTALPAQNASLGDGTIPNNPTTVEIPDELTFKLHSKPAQSAKILLNFQGATTQNTSWNYSGPIISAPFSLDSDPAFNSSELNLIKAIWRSVAEDYASFDVDVTTEPTSAYNYDARHFTQVIISPTWEWYGQAGGVAYVNSFTWGDGTPAFVFSGLLGNNAKYIAEAAAHEAGHTVGLYHTAQYDTNCALVSEYSSGYGSSPGWAPIMGVGYYRGVSQWTKSSEWPLLANSFGCTNEQDDLSVMTASSLKFSPDDVGNTANTAATLPRTLGAGGIGYVDKLAQLGQNDIDMYAFSTIGGDISLSVKPIPPVGTIMGDADFRVRLLDNRQNVVAESDPAAVGTATIEKLAAPSGTYYLEISATGYLDLSQPGGYSTYGSMGQYQIIGTYPATAPSSDTTAPSVALTNPTDGSAVSGTVSVAAAATDNVGVDHVDFYRGTTLIGADASSPYSVTWDTTQTANGTYTLTAKAYDAASNSATASAVTVTVSNAATTPPDTTAPLAAITTPAAGAAVSGAATITVSASDAIGVTKVSFFDGTTLIDTDTTGTPDFSVAWDTTKVANGSHTLIAKAYDAAGNIGASAPVIVYVSNVVAPLTVTISSPQDGASISAAKGGNVTISAGVTTKNKVVLELFIDGTYVTSTQKSSLSYKWNTKTVASGAHTIRVTARDSNGATGEKSITVTK